ncbi:MAG: ribosome assembly cofactor RimP, partial [Spirochaetaceae bacterium]|nr:ribosome assembly cofactor RimP [Spirochaetaceae bacterium]
MDSKAPDPLEAELEPVLTGLGMALVELTVSKHKGGAAVRAVVCRLGTDVSLEDCAKAHRAIMPRIELALGQDVAVEVSSPGIDRKLKHAGEFRHFTGRAVACYRTDISDWTTGILEEAGETG